jgi:phage tail sheath protein FI
MLRCKGDGSMAFQVSPGVNITELDLTAGVQTASLSVGAFVGSFTWGPALDPVSISSEAELVSVFGKPDSNNYEYWFSAQSFLTYSNQLRVVRAISSNALNATSEAKTLTGSVTTNGSVTIVGSTTAFDTQLVVGQTIVINAESLVVATITNATQITVASAPTTGNVSGVSATAYGVLIKNEDQWETTFSNGVSGYGLASAKWAGTIGNSLKISLCPSADAFEDQSVTGTSVTANTATTTLTGSGTAFATDFVAGDLLVLLDENDREVESIQIQSITNATQVTLASKPTFNGTYTSFYRRWEYANQFDAAPGTSAYAAANGATADEMHVVVVDQDGTITGVRNTVIEKFAFVSKASDAKDASGNNNYYVTRLNRDSAFVWWLSHVGTTTNWGNATTSGVTYGGAALPYSKSLVGAIDGNTSLTSGNLQTAWDVFADSDRTDVSLLIAGPASPRTDALYIINNVAEVRKDAVVFLSPRKASVVNNALDEVEDITTDRGSINSSYAVMDSGWKYMYDKFNDVYRWVPLNGDIAGLAARTDTTNDPWWSPAGFTRGNIKNVVKLAWNPKQSQRDDLYKIGVNPVVSFPSQGIVLYGDKTLLTRPSAFDRINVRRLFIALEKTISRYAKAQLFEFNDEFTRSAFRNAVEPFLRDVKARRGVSDYLVICDSTNNTAQVVDSNQFVGDIFVKPTRATNFIQLNFVAVRTGVSFQEVIGAV